MNNLLGLLNAGTTSGGGMEGMLVMVGYILIIGVFFYFFMIRPQKKQEKAHNALISSMEIGDSVLTTAGFYGVVIDVDDDTVIVEFGNNKNCRIPMQKKAIIEIEKANQNEE